LTICHRLLLTPELLDEWKRHRSRYAQVWLGQMIARKKVIIERTPFRDPALRALLTAAAASGEDDDAMQKDAHLLEAALSRGAVIASLDDRARDLFSHAAATVREIRSIEWVNPETDAPLDHWLAAGARSRAAHRLR
jgi:hypothetical protein